MDLESTQQGNTNIVIARFILVFSALVIWYTILVFDWLCDAL